MPDPLVTTARLMGPLNPSPSLSNGDANVIGEPPFWLRRPFAGERSTFEFLL